MSTEDTIPTNIPEPTDELTELKATCEEYLQGWKRAKADHINAERLWRTRESEHIAYAEERILREMLEIVDALDEAVKHTNDPGIEQVRRKMLTILAREQVQLIETNPGDLFDPNIHEALSGEGEMVSIVIRNGYRHNDNVLRAVQVMVK